MEFIKLFSSEIEMNDAISHIKHGDGAYVFGIETDTGMEDITIYDLRHPGSNCLKINPVNMSPVKLDSSSMKTTPEIGDILYSTSDGKLTLDSLTNDVNNTAIAICVIPEVMENFNNGDLSDGAIKTARFVSINYMSYKTPTIGSKTDDNQNMMFGNYGNTIGNVKGGKLKDSYVGGKWNTQQCLSKATNQEQTICNSVTNNSGIGYCAPACCCDAYSTLGTKQGDWYLPMPGELYQLYTNKTTINEKRTTLIGSGFCDGSYWSSRENNSNNEYIVNLSSGNINNSHKDSDNYVLCFLALEI